MKKKNLNIEYTEYYSEEALPEDDANLLEMAAEASKSAYSPYSGFNVGAAVRLNNGEVISASNQENAAYPSGLCAERVAIFYAHARFPESIIDSIAVTASVHGLACDVPTMPCGACRQVMAESEARAAKPIKIIMGGSRVTRIMEGVQHILPFPFNNLPESDK